MKIKIDNKEFELKYSIRTNIIYENITGKSLDLQDLTKFENLISLFYANVVSTLKYNGIDKKYTFDEFIQWIDDNGSDFFLADYINWFSEQMQKNALLMKKTNDNVEDKKKATRKKKS